MLNWNPPVTVYQRVKNENYTRMPTCDTKDTSDTEQTSDLVMRDWASASYAVAKVPRRVLGAFSFFEPGVWRA